MALVHIDSRWGGASDGTVGFPWKTIAAAVIADNDAVLLARGAVFREEFTSTKTAFNNLTIAGYGAGPDPVITGADVVSSWALVSGAVYSFSLGSNIAGNVTENGLPMVFRNWVTDIATVNLQRGEFVFDHTTFVLYISPSSGVPANHIFEVSQRLYCLRSNAVTTGFTLEGVALRQASRHGVVMINKTDWLIQGGSVSVVGGIREGSLYLGNGIEMSHSTNTGTCRGVRFRHIFDSAGTTQLYEASADSVDDHQWLNNDIDGCGLAGVEVSAQTANQAISRVTVRGNKIRNAGAVGWLAKRTGVSCYGAGVVNNGGATVVINDVRFDQNDIETDKAGLLNSSATVAGTNVVATRNKLVGPRRYVDVSTQGVGLSNGTMTLQNNQIEGFKYGVQTAGSATINVPIDNCAFIQNERGTFRNNSNSTFTVRNSLYFGQTLLVTSGNFAGGYTGQNNALWQNVANGASYSSTGDVTADPRLSSDYRPMSGSPLLTGGFDLGYLRDIEQRQARRYIGAYGAAPYRTV